MPRRNRRGLLNVLLTIVVVVAVIVGIFAAYTQISGTSAATRTSVFIRQLAPQISQRYRGDYSGVTAATVISSGFVPSDWRTGNSIKDPEGRDVTIGAVNSNNSFTITFAGGVSTETCKAVLAALQNDPTLEKATVKSNKAAAAYNTTAKIDTECATAPGSFVLQFR